MLISRLEAHTMTNRLVFWSQISRVRLWRSRIAKVGFSSFQEGKLAAIVTAIAVIIRIANCFAFARLVIAAGTAH